MRILFSSTRGAGHLQPLLPYAHALRRLGHEVAVAAPESVGPKLAEHGLAHERFGHPGDEVLGPIWKRMPGLGTEAQATIAMREIFAGRCAEAALPRLLEILRSFRPDLVVRESAEFGSLVAAGVLGIRHARVLVHMASFEEPLFQHTADAVDALRVREGMVADAGRSMRDELTFTAFPASLEDPATPLLGRAPIRARMPEAAPAATKWTPPAGEQPLVYITFGTIAGGNPHTELVFRAALAAVGELPVRALLTTGPSMKPEALGVVPPNVKVEAWVPQAEVLPHAALVVCHGGSGTVLGTAAAGVPMVVSSLGADQPHNAAQLERVGAGIVAAGDAASIRTAMIRGLDGSLRKGARKLADEIAKMPGIDVAVEAMCS